MDLAHAKGEEEEQQQQELLSGGSEDGKGGGEKGGFECEATSLDKTGLREKGVKTRNSKRGR